MRIAILTPEIDIDETTGGGLGAFISRMARALREAGHEPEVFAVSRGGKGVSSDSGFRVEFVQPTPSLLLDTLPRWLFRSPYRRLLEMVRSAAALATAFERRDAQAPFDFVHSSDYGVPGLFVKSRGNAPHVVRCSWVADLFRELDGSGGLSLRLSASLERLAIRRADAAYAPSLYVSEQYWIRHRLKIAVIRPPIAAIELSDFHTIPLPQRFFLYCGQITPRKGTDILAEALPLVWREAPEFTMVWAGRESVPSEMARYQTLWTSDASRVLWLGAIQRSLLHSIMSRAEATVLPSRADNLPNAAIESLSLSTPVISLKNNGVDELIAPSCGEVVDSDDPKELAQSILRAWRGLGGWTTGGFRAPAIFAEMSPSVAAANLLEFMQNARDR
jgi:glycosyltransferase involved in cell wall biosynthesis